MLTPPDVPSPTTLDEAVRVWNRLRRRERQWTAVRHIQAALFARTKLDELEREALKAAIEIVDASAGTIYIHETGKQALAFTYVIGETPEITKMLEGRAMFDDRGISGEVFRTGVSRITPNVLDETKHNQEIDADTSYRTQNMVTVPLKSITGKTQGVLQVINRREGGFDQEDLEILEVIGAQAAVAIETARLFEEARRASVISLIGDISHDVKNLLTPVITGTQTLELIMDGMFDDVDAALDRSSDEANSLVSRAVEPVREFYKEAVSMAVEGAVDVQERVREIADAIKGVISQPHFEPTDLRERVNAVTKVLRLVAERESVTIDTAGVSDAGLIELDRKGIYNALYNLVNNAIPETPPGGVISISTAQSVQNGQLGAEIKVADTGRGMSEAIRLRMFSEHAISTKPGGTGLGTKIVKNVIDAHHGTINVESNPGQGTVFTIWLPAHQPE